MRRALGRLAPTALGRLAPIALLGLLLLAASGCMAQASSDDAPARVGILRSVPDDEHAAFVAELRAQGFLPGTTIELVPASPDATMPDLETARAELREWLAEGLDLVIAYSTPYAQLVHEEAPHLPGLFVVNDPVAGDLVTVPEKPDLGLTGVTFATPADRTLDLASRAVGGASRLGYLGPADDPAVPGHRDAVLEAADELGLEVVEATFAGPEGVAAAVTELSAAEVDAVVLASANATVAAIDVIAEAVDEEGLPVVANTDIARFAVVVLTPDRVEVRRQLARQTARLLTGAPVEAVPVEDPRRFVLIVNRTQAERLGLPELEPGLLRQADVVR